MAMTPAITGIINEEWRTIDGYINFQISNLGNIRDTRTGKFNRLVRIGHGYVGVQIHEEGKRSKQYRVHRLVADAFLDNPNNYPFVDHINRSKSDNTILNLRWCSIKQNNCNRCKQNNTSSGFKGVVWDASRSKWRAYINADGKHIFLGRFAEEEDAAKRYDEKAKELFGEFAKTNF